MSAACIIIELLHTLNGFAVGHFGIANGSPLIPRLTYHFFHANLIHASLNAWCLLSLAFIYDITAWELFISYAIASSYPIDTLTNVLNGLPVETNTLPTVGLSAICFSLIGQVQYRVQRKLYYSTCVCAMIVIGFFFPNANALIHLYCYVVGLMVGFFNSPLPCRK